MDIITRHHMMVAEASICRLSAPSRHRERFRYSERPVSPVQSVVPEREYSVLRALFGRAA